MLSIEQSIKFNCLANLPRLLQYILLQPPTPAPLLLEVSDFIVFPRVILDLIYINWMIMQMVAS